ncbi:MAG TPA: S46 family peptidase [Pyrinomonadaceae bacterium]|nr:S46 family peptidase [Pyrinomonadaceae bacterium]
MKSSYLKATKLLLAAAVLAVSAAPRVRADEGMWTFDNPPLKLWKERYGFEPTAAWLERLRLASVRLAEVGTTTGGGSGAFVSPDGLVATNQHVGAGQIAKLSTPERDLTKNGFYARTRAEELKCPDYEVSVLASYEDVTARVQGAVKPGASPAEANAQREAEIAAVEKESAQKTGLGSRVVKLYSGGEYWLYRYKRYTDVRLVFAPEEQAAFFGGDYDNFTYPRYALDVSFFRVYEGGQPARTENFLRWSKAGPKEGEFVVAPGNPGSTDRLMTVAQLRYQRDTGNPLQMRVWTSRRDALERFAARGPEQARRAQSAKRSLENSIKRLVGQQEGLSNPRSFERKEAAEKALRDAVAARQELRREYASAWDEIEAAYRDYPAAAKRVAFTTLAPSRLGTIASNLVRRAEELKKPDAQRYAEFREGRLPALSISILSPAPVYADMEEAVLAAWFAEARAALGPEDPFVRAALGGSTPEEAARKLVAGTKLADVGVRRALLEGGAEAVEKSDDPLVVFARRMEPIYRELRAWEESHVKGVEASAGQRIALARFAVYGKTTYPDATSTMRVTYGTVKGYEEDTTLVPFKTTFYGLYDRAEGFGGKPPYDLVPRFRERRERLDLSTPLDFVYTADTIGGMSGSPVVNRDAEVVGLNFDSNIQKLPNRYWYVDESDGGRAVAVHSSAVLEALRKLYDAAPLAEELTRQ